MKTKSISLVVLSLGVCTLAYAAEYKTPTVGFKETAPSHKETQVAEFNEEYKVEGAVKTDRQIASEKDSSDREPSSVVAEEKKHAMEEEKKTDEKVEPKPWLYRNKLDSAY
ncbi:MAG: hypothetical protein H7281_09885 [Bacteriovorax sp.]|nr:hypothetical protein [Bacteriovorax sp.]